MPETFTFEDAVQQPESFSFEDAQPESFSFEDAQPKDFRRDELAKQTFEARLEGEQAKLGSALATAGGNAAYWIADALAKVDPTGVSANILARQEVPRTPPILAPEDIDTMVEVAKRGLHIPETAPAEGKLGEVTRGLSEAGKELLSGFTDPGMIAGLYTGKYLPQDAARMFQAQMIGALPATAQHALESQNLEEAVQRGVGLAGNIAFPIALGGPAAGPSVRVPDFVGRQLEMQRGAIPPRGEPVAPVERVTPEQAELAAERMSAPFEGELPKFEETTAIAEKAKEPEVFIAPSGKLEQHRDITTTPKVGITQQEIVLWGFKPGTSDMPVKLSKSSRKSRERDGWVLAEYAKGDEPTGLILQAKEAQPKFETIIPKEDTYIGKNEAGEEIYERKNGQVYRMRNDRPNRPDGYPDFGGDLAVKPEPTPTPTALPEGEQVVAPTPAAEIKGGAKRPSEFPKPIKGQENWRSEKDDDGNPEWYSPRFSTKEEVERYINSNGVAGGSFSKGIWESDKPAMWAYVLREKPDIAPPEPAQPIGQGPGARTGVTAEAPESYSGTALKNAVADIERAGWGLREAPEHLRKSIPEAWIRAGRTLERDVNAGQKLVDELVADPQGRGLTVDESALLLRHKLTLANEMNAAAEGIHTATTPLEKAKSEAYYDWSHEKMLTMLDAIKNRGTAWGQEGRWRQVMAREDFSLATLITHREKALGKKLEPGSKEYNEVKAHADKLQALNTALEERVAKVQADFEASEVRRAMAEAEATKNKELPFHPRIIELAEGYAKKWDVRGAKALENLKAMFGEGQAFSGAPISPAMLDQAIIYGTSKMVRGAVDLAKWTDAMVKDLGEGFRKHAAQVFNASKAAFEKDVNADLGKKGQATVKRVKGALKAELGTEGILKKIARKAENTAEGKLPKINWYLKQLARRYAKEGIDQEGPFLDRMTADVNKVLPNLSRSDVRAIFGGYAEDVRALSKDPVEVIIRDMRGQSQEQHKLDLLRQKIMPPKLQERATPSDIQRQLRKQVEAEKRTGGFAPPDPEAQLRSAMQSAETRLTNQITDLQREIDTGEKIARQQKQPLKSDKLDALRARRDALREIHNEVFKKPDLTDSERLDLWKEVLKDQIAELQDRRRRGDFQPKKKPDPLKYDKEAIELLFQKEVEHRALMEMRYEDDLAKRTTPQIVVDAAASTARFMHMALAGGEFSAVFKQGATGAFGRPIMTARNFAKSLQAFWSEEAQFKIKHDILTRDNSPDYRRRLEFTDVGGRLSTMEEMYMFKMAKWMKKTPGLSHYVRFMDMFQRAFSSFLNLMRADTFDAMKREYGGAPETMDAIANYINVATGRGSKSTARLGGGLANAVFFAPRWSISRFQYLLGQPIIAAGKGNRQMIVNQYARTMIGLGSVYALAYAAGGQVEWDPRSSLFGKIQLGGRVIDPLFGLAPVMRIMAQLITGTRKNAKGQIRPIREGGRLDVQGSEKRGPFEPSGAELIGRFAWSKLAPAPEAFVAATGGENVVGEKFNIGKRLATSVTPITYVDIIRALKEQGVDESTAIDLMAIFGLSSYVPTKPKQPNW